jgi:hypothetical protein
MQMAWLVIAFFFFLSMGTPYGQSVVTLEEDKKGFVYSEESSVNFHLRTNGFELGYLWGSYGAFDKFKYYNVGISNVKDPREYSSKYPLPQLVGISNSYVYGKINSLFQLRAAVGMRKSLSEKPKVRGVVVGYAYEYGLQLGIVKPYMLRVLVPGDGRGEQVIAYSEETANVFLNQSFTRSHAGFRTGWDNVQLRPGLNGRFGFTFSFGQQEALVRSLEAGIDASLYFNAIELMLDRNKPYFINLYLAAQLGWRN